jgi:hypothetical protein
MFKRSTTTDTLLADKGDARPAPTITHHGVRDPRGAPPSPPAPWKNDGSVLFQPYRPGSLHASLIQRAKAQPRSGARQSETEARTMPATVAARTRDRRQFTVRLDGPLSRQVERLAKFSGRTYQDLLETAARKYLGCQPEQDPGNVVPFGGETVAPNR